MNKPNDYNTIIAIEPNCSIFKLIITEMSNYDKMVFWAYSGIMLKIPIICNPLPLPSETYYLSQTEP